MIDKLQDKIPLQDIGMQSFSKEESWSVEDKETSPKSAVPQKRYEDMNDVEKAIFNTKDSKLNKDLSIRHLLTLAVGGAIGTGLFVNSGSSLSTGGPASLVIAWTIISTCLFTIVNALWLAC